MPHHHPRDPLRLEALPEARRHLPQGLEGEAPGHLPYEAVLRGHKLHALKSTPRVVDSPRERRPPSPLNEAQRQAVLHFEGPALVVAGAGSGKTRTVVHRVAYLVARRGVFPSEILAVTFTNKAAEEMRERLRGLVPGAGEVWVSTFHAAALRILRVYGERVGLRPGFVVYDEDDQTALLKEVLKELALSARPGPIKALLDRAKNRGVGLKALLGELPEYYAGLSRGRLGDVLVRYQEALKAQGALDFGDILLYALRLLEEDEEVLRLVRKRARFIHVDEYQDTSPVQYRFTRLLAGEEANLMAVGDPDQGIYSFRAADIKNILDFTRDYPEARVYRLEENYRSTEAILRFANAVIVKNALRLEKALRPVKRGGEPVRLYRAEDAREEARFVAEEIARLGPPGTGTPSSTAPTPKAAFWNRRWRGGGSRRGWWAAWGSLKGPRSRTSWPTPASPSTPWTP